VYVFFGKVQFLPTILMLIATTGFQGCSKVSECEALMAKLFSAHPYKFTSGGCIDTKHAYLYPFDNPHVLAFASVSKDTFVIDSIIDFNHSFAKYASMEELEQYVYYEPKHTWQYVKNAKYELQSIYTSHPVIYRKKDYYQLVDINGIYKISFQDKQFIKILEFDEIKHNFLGILCDSDSAFVYQYGSSFFELYYERKQYDFREYVRKKHFFPEYTKITLDNSQLFLHENGDVVANAEAGYCLYVKKMYSKEEISVFGPDCNLEETCKDY